MKVKFLFIGALVTMMALASCKKDYVCDCTFSGEDAEGIEVDEDADAEPLKIEDVSKSDAEDYCNGEADKANDLYEELEMDITAECDAKAA